MAVREILQGEHPILRQKCEPVTEFDSSLHLLLEDLADTMKSNQGFGLAAPQIGVSLQVFVMDAGSGIQEFINPQLICSDGIQTGVESCLSFPETILELARPKTITIAAKNRHGGDFQLDAADWLARVLIHELDHLHGILFFDHLSEEQLFNHIFNEIGGSRGHLQKSASQFANGQTSNSGTVSVNLDEHQLKDIQMALDWIADASWKLELALDVLHEYQNYLDANRIEMKRLRHIAKKMVKEAGKWERNVFHSRH